VEVEVDGWGVGLGHPTGRWPKHSTGRQIGGRYDTQTALLLPTPCMRSGSAGTMTEGAGHLGLGDLLPHADGTSHLPPTPPQDQA
jgi:hypothetical protein